MTRLLFLLLLALAAPAWAQLPPGQKAMNVRLVAETDRPAAGSRVSLALVMSPKPGWHGYWQNPGDAGAPTRIAWTLPPGVTAGPLRYPVPERLLIAGLMNYVYQGPYAELADVDIPAGLAPGTSLPLRAKVDYLVCTDRICVPESAEVSADLTVGTGGAERRAEFDRYRMALPKPLGAAAHFEIANGHLRIAVPLPAATSVNAPYFYPLTEDAAHYSAPQSVSRSGDQLIVETAAGGTKPAALDGVLSIAPGQGLSVSAAPGPVPPAGTPVGSASGEGAPAAPPLLLTLLGALLGGLLLNIMPCVFPILSLKALSLARAGGNERGARREAVAYTAGVVFVCLALGGILLALRAGGSVAGWGFQLRDPRVILLLLLLVTAIALNLAGLFELPSFGGGEALAGQGGAAGAFWTGALAAFVATPCTGPFMATALGAALLLPGALGLAVFGGLGLGLALPFLLLGFVPPLRRMLPKPGPWMNTLRRILSIPMFLTAVWLAWLLGRLAGNEGLALGIVAALVVAAACWWAARRQRWIPALSAVAVAAVASAVVLPTAAPAQAEAGVLKAQAFSEAKLAALRAQGRPVFVYFTADWCLTCKVNEKAVLDREDVARAFDKRHVAVLVGDWTRGDPEIGRFIEKQGRSGVPLYLWYGPGKAPEVLPQILTVGGVAALAG
ncbi:MAG TPA: thioredoxin family protein [Allosphingosinicella sp.]|jgi:thiol:disulfide interchange protein|nr:thioredoxin family protein [Allosphingosinicella sp.]